MDKGEEGCPGPTRGKCGCKQRRTTIAKSAGSSCNALRLPSFLVIYYNEQAQRAELIVYDRLKAVGPGYVCHCVNPSETNYSVEIVILYAQTF